MRRTLAGTSVDVKGLLSGDNEGVGQLVAEQPELKDRRLAVDAILIGVAIHNGNGVRAVPHTVRSITLGGIA